MRSKRRRIALLILLAAALGAPATASLAYWTGIEGSLKGPGVASAAIVNGGAVPTAANAGGTSATVRWGASTLSNSAQVSGYIIRRYLSSTGVEHVVGAGCAGTQTTRICTESGIEVGTWRYTVTPVVGSSWTGAESSRSGGVSVAAAAVTLTKRLFAAPLPTQTTGAVTGFGPGEQIVYTYGPSHTAMTGAPTVVGADGSATITALTIPAIADGSYTVHVVGASSGAEADAGIVIDTTPPVMTPNLTPAPNAAGWNRTPVKVDGTITDGSGSGVDYVKITTDGSDPRTSPTALLNPAPATVSQSETIKAVGADIAGNESAILTVPLKIDVTPPVFTADLVNVVGNAYAATVPTTPPGLVFYRGGVAGSFALKFTFIDDGGSPAASIGTSDLVGVASGFTHVPSVVTQPAGGPYVTSTYSWLAGTTSQPTGTITVTDLAGNTLVLAGALTNDSAAPTGGSVEATGLVGTGGRYSNSMSISLALSRGTDAGSGLAESGAQLLRASASLSSSDGLVDGVCGTYSAFAQVGANDPGATVIDAAPTDGRCYRYSYTVPDVVGNVATYLTPDIKVEAASPASLTPSAPLIVPVTGLPSQYVSGSTLYYRPAQTGSFTVSSSASDAWSGIVSFSFPVLAGFSGGGPVTTPSSGTTFRTTYTWSNNPASASPGAQTLTATDNAARSPSNPAVFSVIKDDTGPTHGLSLTAATGAYLSGATLWYRPTASGSFKFVDALSDDTSGAASVTYPTLGLSGWTHNTQTVSTPTGGPFTSSTFSWTSFPSSPGSFVITGVDRLGTSSTTTLTFNQDQSPPSGVSITYPSGIVTSLSVPITLGGSDGGSGLNASSGIVKRDQATLNTTSNNCGSFPGTFATTVTLSGGADKSVTTARCYKYRYLVSDNVGNQATYTSGTVVKVKTT